MNWFCSFSVLPCFSTDKLCWSLAHRVSLCPVDWIFFVVPKHSVSSPCAGSGKEQLVLHSSHWQRGEHFVSPLGNVGSWGGSAGISRAGRRAAQPELEFPSLLHWEQKFVANNLVMHIVNYVSILLLILLYVLCQCKKSNVRYINRH